MTNRAFKQTARGAFTRRLLVESTATCLVNNGYGATTTAAICSEAGLTAGALFGQFPNKSALLVEVASELVAQAGTLVQSAFLGLPHDLEDALVQLFDNLMEVWRTPTLRALGELWAAARTDPPLAKTLVDADAGSDGVLSGLAARYLAVNGHDALPALARVVIDSVAGRTIVEDARAAAGYDSDDAGREDLRATLATLGRAAAGRITAPVAVNGLG